jgi:hypothetical protein
MNYKHFVIQPRTPCLVSDKQRNVEEGDSGLVHGIIPAFKVSEMHERSVRVDCYLADIARKQTQSLRAIRTS